MSFSSKFVVVVLSIFFMMMPVLAFAQDEPVDAGSGNEIEYTTIQNINMDEYNPDPNKTKRIWTSVGFSVLYDAALLTSIFFMMSPIHDSKGKCLKYEGDYQIHEEHCVEYERSANGGLVTVEVLLGLSTLIAPALAVHTSHAIWGGQGSLGWTYGMSALGTAVGVGLTALFFIPDYKNEGVGIILTYIGGPILTIVLGTLGAILGYEISNNRNIESQKQASIKNIRPIIELTEERKVFGIGFDF